MKSVVSVLTWAALSAVALAKPVLLNSNYDIVPGKTFTFTWSDASSVSLNLKQGPSTALYTVLVITPSASGSSYTWTVPADLPTGSYAVEIIDPTDSSNPNYSSPFQVSGTTGSLPPITATGSATGSSSRSATITSTSASSSGSATSSSSGSASSTTGSSSSSKASSSGTSTTTSTSTRTSASSSSTTTPPNNGAGSLAAPIAAPLLFIAGLAIF